MENNEAGLLSQEDLDLLRETRKVRMDLIKDMTVDGVPTRSGDIRVLNETLDATDRQVMELAKLKAKQQENDTNNAAVGLVVEILNKVGASGHKQLTNVEVELPDDFIPVDIVPGETDINAEELDLSNFIRGGDDE